MHSSTLSDSKTLDALELAVEQFNTWLFYIKHEDSLSLEEFISKMNVANKLRGNITLVEVDLCSIESIESIESVG